MVDVIFGGSTNEYKFLRNLTEDMFAGWSYQSYFDRLMN